jgi:hypothetical protein
LGPDLVCVAENDVFRIDYGIDASEQFRIRGFECGGLATSVFLVNVLDHIAGLRGRAAADISLFAEDSSVRRKDPPEMLAARSLSV